MATRFTSCLVAIEKIIALGSAGIVFVLMALISTDVILRYIFNRPIPSSAQMAETGMVIIIFLALAYTQATNRNMRVGILINRLNPKQSLVFDILAYSIGFFLFALIAWQGWIFFWKSWLLREYMLGPVRVPYYISKFAVPIGAFFLCLQYLVDTIIRINQLFKRKS